MQFLVHQQMNILSGAVIFLFGIYAFSVLDKRVPITRIYIASLFLNLSMIIFEVVLGILSETQTGLIWVRMLSCLLCILSPLLSFLFMKFICTYYPSPIKLKKTVRYAFYILIAFNSITAISSFNTKTFEPANFSRYIIPFVISMIFLVYSIYVIVLSKKMLLKFEYAYILAISLVTNAVVFVQLCINQTTYIWCSSSFTIIMMYIIIQQRELFRDSLTGVRNRVVLNKCLDKYRRKLSEQLSIVMIDLDHFKDINDSYGHLEGDIALKAFARLLQKVYSENGTVFRMGGDEFLILIYDLSPLQVNDLITKMAKMVEKYNIKCGKPYMLKYSSAYGTYKNDMSVEQFIHEIDLKMYEHKKARKRIVWGNEREL